MALLEGSSKWGYRGRESISVICGDWNQEKYPELGTVSLRQSNSSSLCKESTVGREDELTGYGRTELEA